MEITSAHSARTRSRLMPSKCDTTIHHCWERERKISLEVGRDSGRKWSWFYYAIADRGCRGETEKIRAKNYLDDDEVAMFKAEALARHEFQA